PRSSSASPAPPGNTQAFGTKLAFSCRRIISTSNGSPRSRITLAAGTGVTSVMLALPADPLLAVRPALLLPDRHRLLDAIDHRAAGLERFRAMRRRAGDGNRRVADHEVAEAMHHGDGDVGKRGAHAVGTPRHLLLRHRQIRFVHDRLDRFPFV